MFNRPKKNHKEFRYQYLATFLGKFRLKLYDVFQLKFNQTEKYSSVTKFDNMMCENTLYEK